MLRLKPTDARKARRWPDAAYRGRLLGAEAPLEILELSTDAGRELVAELGEVLLDLRQLGRQRVGVDAQQLVEVGGVDVEAVGVQVGGRRHEAERGLLGAALAVGATEDPLEHAAVLAEARPQEAAALVLAEPVDVEDLRQDGAVALADLQP